MALFAIHRATERIEDKGKHMATTLTIITLLIGISTLIGVVFKIMRLIVTLTQQIEEHEQKLNCDYERLTKLKETDELSLRIWLTILDHMIDGNHVEKMKATRQKIIDRIGKI